MVAGSSSSLHLLLPYPFRMPKFFIICPPATFGEALECGKGGDLGRCAVVAGSSSSLHLLLAPLSNAKNSSTYAHLLRLERSLNEAREELLYGEQS